MTASLYDIQQELKNFILEGRKGTELKLPEHTYGRISIYRDLIYKMLQDMLQNMFPLTYKFLKDDWANIIADLYKTHTADDAVLAYQAEKFPLYLQEKQLKPDFLAELAWYEWLEAELQLAKDEKKETGITPVHIVADFEYPITKIVEELRNDNLSYAPEKKAEQILIFRDEESLKVKFFVLAPTTAIALEMLDKGEALDQIAEKIKENFKLPEAYESKLMTDLEHLVKELKLKHILLQ